MYRASQNTSRYRNNATQIPNATATATSGSNHKYCRGSAAFEIRFPSSIPEEGNRKFNCWIRHELFIGEIFCYIIFPSRENTLNGCFQTNPYFIRLQCETF
ncbi:hypothetical protein CEXT_182531 [Caerostris extrusa]|uniref:Uncharacterized protein n=1 Tax=Caerostris extrusa TaxID=172846 RepID=A0AAV4MV75_CAEEX|nr:hypothetical protein CEXT_182531 [Caerostris extrusa]